MPEKSPGEVAQFCGQCGAALRPDARFCTACGATVQSEAAPRTRRPDAAVQAKGGSRLWLLIVAAVALIGLLAVVYLLSRPAQPATVAAPAPVAPAAPAQQDIPFPNIARVGPGEAHGSANAGQSVIVDVRDREFYDQSHMAGAVSIPLNELPARLDELPRDRQILTYCT